MHAKSISFLIALALSPSAVANSKPATSTGSDGLEKATCSITCDDGTSCEISSGNNQPKQARLADARLEATEAVRRAKPELLLASPTIGAWYQRLEIAEGRGDREQVEEALFAIAAEAAAVNKPILLTPKVSCSCSGMPGRQATCDY
jgi:hypothetical protein